MPRATGGKRIAWEALPAGVAASITQRLGSAVVRTDSQPCGFSEGIATRVHLANGGTAFVKAASTRAFPAVAGFHRREITVAQRLPPEVPAARLLDSYDDGDWVALMFENIPGRLPAQPWDRAELDAVLATVTDLARLLTPSPIDPSTLGQPRLGGWLAVARDPVAVPRVAALAPWAGTHLDELCALEEKASLATVGNTLLHGDLYPFNIMLTADRVYVVDWPHARIGHAACDAITLMSSASLSGIDPQPLADAHPLTRGLDPVQINVLLALHAGFLLRAAAAAGPSADGHLVDMMAALGTASLRWLRDRL